MNANKEFERGPGGRESNSLTGSAAVAVGSKVSRKPLWRHTDNESEEADTYEERSLIR